MESVSDDLDYVQLSKLTQGFSGSDIREACRTASVYRYISPRTQYFNKFELSRIKNVLILSFYRKCDNKRTCSLKVNHLEFRSIESLHNTAN